MFDAGGGGMLALPTSDWDALATAVRSIEDVSSNVLEMKILLSVLASRFVESGPSEAWLV